MPHITPNDIHNIHDFDTLLDFLREKFGWHIPEDVEFEDVAYSLSAEELDLDELTQDRIGDYWQLPPFPPSQPTLGIFEDTQPWGIFFLQFNSEDIYRTALRRVLRGLVERRDRNSSLPTWKHDHLLFICTTTDFQRFAFAHFASNENWRRAVLSIFSWEQGDTHIRTLCEYNLPALAFPSDGFSDDKAWLKAWQEAFDVEAVTDKFFADYQRVFAQVEKAVKGIPEDETEARRLYTQRLFNRLMFLRFIEKKGWLTYNGNRDYLRVLFDATESGTDENFLNDRLYWAFFHGLGNAADQPEESSAAVERRGGVPFLNGGLFEMQKDDVQNAVHIPNDKFAEILELFERYNFTVTESTPLDIEVAVDPEMLGKVFEELVTGRHDTGSYYTPRPVVSFMCRESLKICLQNKTDETPEILQAFIDDGDATKIRNPERVLQVLQTLRICDPACGSGAYLLGMMGELLRLREALFQSNQIDSPIIYQRKLDIIQKNLYGVDKDEFAVNIAMLRLWLSLAVDYEGDTPEPLPNLDYKVAAGDSLTGPAPEQIGLEADLIQQIQEHQAEYLVTHTDPEKQRLREVIAELKESLQGWQANADVFVWQVEFSEVFQEGGFDIIVGNPPYVRQENIIPIKPVLEQLFPEVFTGTADLYVYFYKRGAELLRTGGVLSYISSNNFLRVAYGKKLRSFFTNRVKLHRLLDFGNVPVFKAHVDTCILLAESAPPADKAFFAATFRDKADIPRLSEAFREKSFSMDSRDLSPDGWALTSSEVLRLLARLQQIGTPLEEYVDGGFYMGVKTGCNDAFIIDKPVCQKLIAENARSGELIKPVLRGRNLRRWKANSTNEYLIVIASSANREWPWSDARNTSEAEQIFAETYPAVYNHLKGYRDQLIARGDQGMFYWELRSCVYYAEFKKPKVIYPQTAKALYGCYDTAGTFGLNNVYFIPTRDLSLLAVLNSRLFDWYARHKFYNLNDPWEGGRLQFFAQYMEKVPIADRTAAQKAELSRLVEQILAAPESDGVRDIEQKIDELVYQLYGLTDAEVELIKQTYQDAGMEV
ncbi:type I restriction endonuclease subunit M [Candidatus Poribacteria bacterium]|nr:MAG: type I restriction endonuclease subunit M [Candidatus Poribacteria bacterium]